MVEERGFLRFDRERNRFSVNEAKTLSIVAAEHLLREVLAARRYIHGRLLDVGCGSRPFALVYDSLVTESLGTEVPFSPYGTQQADVLCFAETLPFPDGHFDVVLLTEVLEHTLRPQAVLSECARVVRSGGHVLMSVPFIYPLHDWPHDYWRFTHHGLELACREATLEPVVIHPKGGPGAVFLSQWIQIATRATDGISKMLRLSRPLRQFLPVRWALVAPQRLFLFLSRVVRLPAVFDKLSFWMTLGFFVVAVRGSFDQDRSFDRRTERRWRKR